MTVAELIELLQKFDPVLKVYIWDNGDELNDGDWYPLRVIDVKANRDYNRLEIL